MTTSAQVLDPARTAVLSMDFQAGIVSIYAGTQPNLVSRSADVRQRSRAEGLTILHVQVGFRPGLPDISPRNPLFAAIRDSPRHQQLFEGIAGAIHPAVAPQSSDIVITPHRISAFTGTDLDMILQAKEINTLVLSGSLPAGWYFHSPARVGRRLSPDSPEGLLRGQRARGPHDPPEKGFSTAGQGNHRRGVSGFFALLKSRLYLPLKIALSIAR